MGRQVLNHWTIREVPTCLTVLTCRAVSELLTHTPVGCLLLGRKVMTNLDSILKSRDIILPTKFRLVKAMVFPVVMYGCELDCEESWTTRNWCFWTVVLENTLEIPLDCKEAQPVNPTGNQSWIFNGKTDAEPEAPILWPHDAKSQFTGKDIEVGKDWGQEEKRATEDGIVGCHHWLNGRES